MLSTIFQKEKNSLLCINILIKWLCIYKYISYIISLYFRKHFLQFLYTMLCYLFMQEKFETDIKGKKKKHFAHWDLTSCNWDHSKSTVALIAFSTHTPSTSKSEIWLQQVRMNPQLWFWVHLCACRYNVFSISDSWKV